VTFTDTTLSQTLGTASVTDTGGGTAPAGTGFTYYFNDDPPARASVAADQDSLRRYLTSPTGSLASPNGSANSAADDSVKREPVGVTGLKLLSPL
jgi:hypothetical protein